MGDVSRARLNSFVRFVFRATSSSYVGSSSGFKPDASMNGTPEVTGSDHSGQQYQIQGMGQSVVRSFLGVHSGVFILAGL